MNLIDIDSLELAAYLVVVDDTNQAIQIEEDVSRNPDTGINGGYLKVQIKLNGTGKIIGTSIMHYLELEKLVETLKE